MGKFEISKLRLFGKSGEDPNGEVSCVWRNPLFAGNWQGNATPKKFK